MNGHGFLLKKRLASRKEILKSKHILHLAAVLDKQIIGFADAGPIRSDSRLDQHPYFKDQKAIIGEIYAIYLLEQHKGKGVGKALYKRCRIWFKQHGMETFVTWVLANNQRARRFYESEGGKIIGEMTIKIGDKEYQEVCYLFTTLLSEAQTQDNAAPQY